MTLLQLLPVALKKHYVAVPNPEFEETFAGRTFLRRHLDSALPAFRSRHLFRDVRFFIIFIGWPRSGHSLFGALLDAHPNIIVSHELNALPLVDAGYTRTQLFWNILDNSQRFARIGRGWSGYSYVVPNQWQGRYDRLHVIGDKKGGETARYLAYENGGAISLLRERLDVPIRAIFYHRNPFDILATMARRANMSEVTEELVASVFRKIVPTIETVRNELASEETIEVHHERFLAEPRVVLQDTLRCLGENASPDYLDDCCSLLAHGPRKSREMIPWQRAALQHLEHECSRYDFLRAYRFESPL